MTPLLAHLLNRIDIDGPISIAEYMGECLLHPVYGYYTNRRVFGTDGDFTTAPEISQMFGELAGLCLAQSWLDQGAPSRFTLAELGPGRGTLMADILRATRQVPGFHDAMNVLLVEASPALRDTQRQTLAAYDVRWADDLSSLMAQPLFLIANEFFDALPIRQFIRSGDGWSERRIGREGDALRYGLTPPLPQTALAHRLNDTEDGELVETCTPATEIIRTIAAHIAAHGGVALIVDYGGWRSRGDTLQAVKAHDYCDPLLTPGEADLTAHVDFEALSKAAEGVSVTGMTLQGVWLERLGITERAKALATRLTGPARASHIKAHRRLTHPEEMGTLFKAMALYPAGVTAPPGLDTNETRTGDPR